MATGKASAKGAAGAKRKASGAEAMTLRALNRATLARQALLAREKSAARVIERVVGLQAQWPKPPFVGLWSRVAPFERDDLMRLVHGRKVVRATMMRGTLHLVGAKDYIRLRPALQPVLARGMRSILRDRLSGLDVDALVEEARRFFLAKPRTMGELREHLVALHPDGDERAMGYAVRMTLPLVQLPAEEGAGAEGGPDWGFPADSDFAVAESWLGEALDPGNDAPDELVVRYLAAFGPATVGDAQAWSGLQGLAPVFERLRGREALVTFRDERGRELFDVPGGPRPPEETAAPVRFLPEFDNVIVSRADARFVPLAHRKKVFLSALRVRATVLVDGVAAGTWKVVAGKKGGAARVVVEMFEGVGRKVRGEVEEEGEGVGRFVEPGAGRVEVEVGKG